MMASEHSSSLHPHSCPEYTLAHTHTHAVRLEQPPPLHRTTLVSALRPRTFDQSDSDVIAKVAGGCYIPAWGCSVRGPASAPRPSSVGSAPPCHLATDSTLHSVGPGHTNEGHPGTELTRASPHNCCQISGTELQSPLEKTHMKSCSLV